VTNKIIMNKRFGIMLLVLGAITPAVSTSALPTPTQEGTQLIAQQLRNYCREGESTFLMAETQNYWVNICGGDLPHTYVGVNKRNGNSIRVDLRDYSEDGEMFEAVNGNVSYLLVRGTPRGDFLTVTQGRREILREPILRWE
jgi:hypothetical protein